MIRYSTRIRCDYCGTEWELHRTKAPFSVVDARADAATREWGRYKDTDMCPKCKVANEYGLQRITRNKVLPNANREETARLATNGGD